MIRTDIGDPGSYPNNTTPQFFPTNLPAGVGRLVVHNDSPYAIDITTADGIFRVASGVGRLIPVQSTCPLATWAVVASLMPSQALYSDLLIEAYGADEEIDEQYPVNIIRQQASNATVIANELGTSSDGLAVTVPAAGSATGTDILGPYANGATSPTRDVELDVLTAGALVQALTLLGADASTQIAQYLQILGSKTGSAPATGLFVTSASQLDNGKLVTDGGGNFATIGNQATQGGNFGVPVVVKTNTPGVILPITSTGLQTLATFVAPTNGLYRLNMSIRLNNGTSGNAIKAGADYTDADTGLTSNLRMIGSLSGSGTVVCLVGATSVTNGRFHCTPGIFRAQSLSTISIIYQDPTNTPSDTVEYLLERLS